MRLVLAAFGALVIWMGVGLAHAVAADPATLQIVSHVYRYNVERERIWFDVTAGLRFTADPRAPGARRLERALRDSRRTGRSLTVQFDPDAGVIDDTTMIPTFGALSATYRDEEVLTAGSPAVPPRKTEPAFELGQLARAFAFAETGDLTEGRKSAERALSSNRLDADHRLMALRKRAAILHELASEHPGPDAARDELRLGALSDLQAVLQLAPNDSNAAISLARVLAALGAYDESVKIFERLQEVVPGNAYWLAIDKGAIRRAQGRPDLALEALDDLVRRKGPQDGMPYHYHRGWTLTELGRYEDAVAEFTLGLKAQPDYGWALAKRACAYGKLGKIKLALADQERAAQTMDQVRSSMPGRRSIEHNARRMAAIVEELRDALANAPQAPTDVACEGYWAVDEQTREISPALRQPNRRA